MMAHHMHAGPKGGHETVELEHQFVLRLPPEPAAALKEALAVGASNIKERLRIQLGPEKEATSSHLRRGQVIFDGWKMSAKMVDLPTIIESQKTMDKKTFYKTADIAQMLICHEGEPSEDEEATSPNKNIKPKDPNKVDRKYVFQHGIVPPLKNCRKRRFRKTLRKKHIEAPEIEKEVKRLLRVDNDATKTTYDLISEEELNASGAGDTLGGGEESNLLDHQDLFGALSDSDDMDDDDDSRRDVDIDSEADSQLYPTASNTTTHEATSSQPDPGRPKLVTEFSKDMFKPAPEPVASAVSIKMDTLKQEINRLKSKKSELERNIVTCDNQVLKIRFEDALQRVLADLVQKESEADGLAMMGGL
eukprot:snap_masked-scaffold170_size291898-processed-gene-0.4 protein:Tk03004 transcript:snap_masked-scaffold170_size291898-processed-gene-0.4-mRNA-1 annotation:"hypothetical protein KGM_08713"